MSSNKHYGKRTQEECIDDLIQLTIDYPKTPMEVFYREVSKCHNNISTRTLRRWFDEYIKWGEYPHVIASWRSAYDKKCKAFKRTDVITDEVVDTLRIIVDTAPELYLDEIAEELGVRTGTYLPMNTIQRVLDEKLDYSLQVCYESAKQRDEIERERYKAALESLVKDVRQVIVIDETHKDKRASRRRRAWGKRNSGGIPLKKWYKNEIRYTMIAGFNVDGFEDNML